MPTEAVTGVALPSWMVYDEAAAAPFSARNASVTINAPLLVNANPYGVGPDDGRDCGAPSRPSTPTANDVIESVPRSVTTSVPPSRENPTCAGSAFITSVRSEPAMETSRPSAMRNPVTLGAPVLRTKTTPSCSVMLFGAGPVAIIWADPRPSSLTGKMLTSSLAAFATSTYPRPGSGRPSPAT